MPLSADQILHNRYRVDRLIGQGGYGAVYLAWDSALNQPCALKENLDTSPEAQRQFQREATILAGLRHPNLPRVTDHFFLPDQGQYLVMDFVDGKNLKVIVNESGGPLSEESALGWLGQVLNALEYLHNQPSPIIHRDIKPQNIIITPHGQAMLVDFGISKIYDPQAATTSGARGITPGFAPPEQYGTARTDARSDLYALASTLYFLLTDRMPPDALDRLVHHTALPDLRQLNPAISPAVEQAVIRGMETESQKRFQSAAELRAALQVSKPLEATGQPFNLTARQPVSAPLQAPAPPSAAPSGGVAMQSTPASASAGAQSVSAPASAVAQPIPATTHRPAGVTWTSIFCLVSGGLAIWVGFLSGGGGLIAIAGGLLGLAAGFLMLRGKALGRKLAIGYLVFLIALTLLGVLLTAQGG